MFNNPIKPADLSVASSESVVQNDSTGAALSGIATILSGLEASARRNTGPDAWEVKAEWETEGSQQAAADAKEYKFLKSTRGTQYADVWLNNKVIERRSSMVSDSADKYHKSLTDLVGRTRDVIDREFEIQEEQRLQAKVNDHKEAGMKLAMADGSKFGLDPAKMSEDSLIGLSMMYEGQKARAEEQSRNVALQQAQLNLGNDQRKLRSQVGVNTFLAQKTAETKASLFAALEAMKQNPAEADNIRLAAIANFELNKSSVLTQSTGAIRGVGGDVSDVDGSHITAIGTQYDTAIKVLRGDYGLDLAKSKLDNLAYSTTLDALGSMPQEMSRLIAVQHVTKVPLNAAETVIKATNTSVNPDAQFEVIRNLGLGVSTAVQNTGEPAGKWVNTLVAAVPQIKQSEAMRKEFASTLVNTLQESFAAPLSIRQTAASPDVLPNLMGKLARSDSSSELGAAIQEAASREGLTPPELWQKSTAGVIREKIAPSLQFEDPAVMGNLDLKYSGGKFTVRLKEAEYRKVTGLTPNISNLSGRDMTADKINRINRNLTVVQQVLNDSVQSYVKTVGGNPDDVGIALEELMKLTFKITNQEE